MCSIHMLPADQMFQQATNGVFNEEAFLSRPLQRGDANCKHKKQKGYLVDNLDVRITPGYNAETRYPIAFVYHLQFA